jgi:hypothetical protein
MGVVAVNPFAAERSRIVVLSLAPQWASKRVFPAMVKGVCSSVIFAYEFGKSIKRRSPATSPGTVVLSSTISPMCESQRPSVGVPCPLRNGK